MNKNIKKVYRKASRRFKIVYKTKRNKKHKELKKL